MSPHITHCRGTIRRYFQGGETNTSPNSPATQMTYTDNPGLPDDEELETTPTSNVYTNRSPGNEEESTHTDLKEIEVHMDNLQEHSDDDGTKRYGLEQVLNPAETMEKSQAIPEETHMKQSMVTNMEMSEEGGK